MIDDKRRVLLGHITGAHGIRGQVLIKSYTESPEDIDAYGPLEDEAGQRSFAIEVDSVMAKGVIARVEGVLDRTSAEKLKGTALYVSRDRLPDTAEDEYYYTDLVGLDVLDPSGAALGTVLHVLNFGAGDILEVRRDAAAKRTDLYPMRADVVLEIDLALRRIVLQPPDAVEVEDEPREP